MITTSLPCPRRSRHGRSPSSKRDARPPPDRDKLADTALPIAICFNGPDGDGVEDFLNHLLQRTHDAREDKERDGLGAVPLWRVKMSPAAKARAEVLNLLGWWSDRGVFDKICLCCGLQWHVDGNTVIFETAEEHKGKK